MSVKWQEKHPNAWEIGAWVGRVVRWSVALVLLYFVYCGSALATAVLLALVVYRVEVVEFVVKRIWRKP